MRRNLALPDASADAADMLGLLPAHGLPPPQGAMAAWYDIDQQSAALDGHAQDADERAWRDAKFEKSGNPHPAEGELVVVIEYCYNSGQSISQLTTKHGEHRYHEEAELVKQFFCNYHSGAHVHVLALDFRTERRGGNRVRLGAFEIDARLVVDGQLVTHNLWSKLQTSKWPQWPGWQERVRALLPIFALRLRPASMRTDGSTRFLDGSRVQVLNHDRTRVITGALYIDMATHTHLSLSLSLSMRYRSPTFRLR